jgi:hypothetical protein
LPRQFPKIFFFSIGDECAMFRAQQGEYEMAFEKKVMG